MFGIFSDKTFGSTRKRLNAAALVTPHKEKGGVILLLTFV